jgi:hypothetical protein
MTPNIDAVLILVINIEDSPEKKMMPKWGMNAPHAPRRPVRGNESGGGRALGKHAGSRGSCRTWSFMGVSEDEKKEIANRDAVAVMR